MKLNNILLVISLFICCNTGCSSCSRSGRNHERHSAKASNKNQKWEKGYVFVTKVIDGDTFWIDNGSISVKVRFIGIDAPEIRNSAHKKKGYFAEEAKRYVAELAENKWVRLELDVKRADQYQRLLAYVYLEDGTFLNADLVAKGYAIVDTYPPNVKYVERFADLQKAARHNHLGLWAN